jgi:hypothetical protein
MMSTPHRDCLLDVGDEIRRRAFEANSTRDGLDKGTADQIFQSCGVMAFNEVISIMLQTANGLGVARDDLRLSGMDPDQDLA